MPFSITMYYEFNITTLDWPGKQNTVVDFLSRIQNGNNDIPIEDDFIYEYSFETSIKYPWFADISNCLDQENYHHICFLEKKER